MQRTQSLRAAPHKTAEPTRRSALGLSSSLARLWGTWSRSPEPPVLTHLVCRGVLPVAIQLKTTLRMIELQSLPQLDLLRDYKLYTSEHESNGLVWHRLRLGFFSDTASATALLSELKCHFKEVRVVAVGRKERQSLLSGRGRSRFIDNHS